MIARPAWQSADYEAEVLIKCHPPGVNQVNLCPDVNSRHSRLMVQLRQSYALGAVTLWGPDSRGRLQDVSRGGCSSCQVSAVLPKSQVFLEFQQALLIVEAHVVGGAGLPCQVQLQRAADLLLDQKGCEVSACVDAQSQE